MKDFLRHMSPALASCAVWVSKVINAFLGGKVFRLECLEITTWALISLLMGCMWRVATDEKTLATARLAETPFTKLLLNAERAICFILLLIVFIIGIKGSAACVNLWLAPAMYVVYTMFPIYLLIGYLIYWQFNSDRQPVRVVRRIA